MNNINQKPDWRYAPEWARYTAMDNDGTWWWYQDKPEANIADMLWTSSSKTARVQIFMSDSALWLSTLEERK